MLSRWLTRSRSRGGDDADFVSIESSEEKTVEITDLTPETSYKLTAIAYNADQRPSNPATATFTTPEKPTTPDPDKATISIEEVKATYNSVTFTLKTANAARFGYKVDVPDGTAELTFVNGSEGGTYTTDNLEAATDYQITAVAYDENGQAADPVTHAFKTEALPTGPAVVSIEEVATTHSSIRFTLKLDNAVRIAYKVDVPDGTAEMTVVEKPQQSTFLVGSLQAETDYVLTVVAYNGKDEPSEPATHSFTTPAYTAFARIDAVATAHGIYLKADVDTGKFPLYFLKIFDPDLTESSADFEEHFKVDSREQFIHYLEVASLTAGLKTASFEEWNKTLLSTRSQQVLLYAAPVVRQGVDVVCEDYGEIIEIPLTIPARDELGAGQAAVTLGEPQVAGKELEIALTKQDGVVSYYAGYATKSDVEAAGTPEQFVQAGLDAKTYDYDITADFQGTWKTDRLSPGSEYYFFSFAYDAEGKLGPLQYKEFHTEAAGTDYDTSLTVDIALKTASFTSATFSVKRNGFEKSLLQLHHQSRFRPQIRRQCGYIRSTRVDRQREWLSDNAIQRQRHQRIPFGIRYAIRTDRPARSRQRRQIRRSDGGRVRNPRLRSYRLCDGDHRGKFDHGQLRRIFLCLGNRNPRSRLRRLLLRNDRKNSLRCSSQSR